MKRGTVMALEGGTAVVLTPDGQFVRVKNRGRLQVGQEISGGDFARAVPRTSRRIFQAGASVAAVLLVIVAYALLRTPPVVAYVSMDVNPSVEFGLDKSEKVRELRAMNDDAGGLIEGIAYRGRELEPVMNELARKLVDGHILTPEDGDIVIASVPVGKIDGEWERQVTDKMIDILNETSKSEETPDLKLEITTISVPKEVREEAESYGISSGKMAFWLVSEDQGHEVELERLKKESLKDIASSWGGVKKVLGEYEGKPAANDKNGKGGAPSAAPSASGKVSSNGNDGQREDAKDVGKKSNPGRAPDERGGHSGKDGNQGEANGRNNGKSSGQGTANGGPEKANGKGKWNDNQGKWNGNQGNANGNQGKWNGNQGKAGDNNGKAAGNRGESNEGNDNRNGPPAWENRNGQGRGDANPSNGNSGRERRERDEDDDRDEEGNRMGPIASKDGADRDRSSVTDKSGEKDAGIRKDDDEDDRRQVPQNYREGRENEKDDGDRSGSVSRKSEKEDVWKKLLDNREKKKNDGSKEERRKGDR